jgi:hypothetical protein
MAAQIGGSIAAFLFARNVERCSYCTNTKAVYDAGGIVENFRGKTITVRPRRRSEYALDFMKKFADPQSPYYWP